MYLLTYLHCILHVRVVQLMAVRFCVKLCAKMWLHLRIFSAQCTRVIYEDLLGFHTQAYDKTSLSSQKKLSVKPQQETIAETIARNYR